MEIKFIKTEGDARDVYRFRSLKYRKNSLIHTIKKNFYRGVTYFLQIPNIIFYLLFFCLLIVLEYSNFHLNPDASAQLHSLKNFVNGNGITITTLDSFGNIYYKPLSWWPAGFVIFAAPIYLITKSAIASYLILKFTSNIFFILFLSKILNYLELKDHQKKFIILFFAISIAPFVEFYVTDMLATTVCMWSFYFYLKFQEHGKISNVLISVFLVSLCYFIRYSFLPFLFYPIAAFILNEKKQIFKKIKEFILIIAFTASAGLFFYFLNKFLVGPGQLVSSMDALHGHGHWNQLTRFKGFLFTFGLYRYNFENIVMDATGLFFRFNWLSIAITTYLYFILIKYFFKNRLSFNNKHLPILISISVAAGALIVAFLSFLTINNPGQTWTTPYWTFVEETRYYGPVIIIGLLNILVIFLYKRKGSLIHAIVLFMVILNVLAYRRTIRTGFYNNNFNSYLETKKSLRQQMFLSDDQSVSPVVYFQKEAENSYPYLYLQSEGTILLDSSLLESKNKRYSNFILIKDSAYSFHIAKLN